MAIHLFNSDYINKSTQLHHLNANITLPELHFDCEAENHALARIDVVPQNPMELWVLLS